MAKSTHYLSKHKDIISKLAGEFSLTEEQVSEIIDHFFVTLKKYITDPRMPTIKISKWGTFRPSIGKIDWIISRLLWHMSFDRGDWEKMFKTIRVIQRVKERLLQEKAKVRTWTKWKNLKVEDLEAESKDW